MRGAGFRVGSRSLKFTFFPINKRENREGENTTDKGTPPLLENTMYVLLVQSVARLSNTMARVESGGWSTFPRGWCTARGYPVFVYIVFVWFFFVFFPIHFFLFFVFLINELRLRTGCDYVQRMSNERLWF